MIFQWPAQKPEPQGHSRRARRRQSAENIAMGGYMNLDGTYNESFQKAIVQEPLPKPVNPFGRPVLPQREANAPRYKKLKHQLRNNALVRKQIPKGEDDALATIIGTDKQGRDIVAPRGFDPVWDDDMETVIGHMDWQNGIAVPLGHAFPEPEIISGQSGSDELFGNQGDDTLEDLISTPGMPTDPEPVVHHAGPMRFAGVKPAEEPEDAEEDEETSYYPADERFLPWFEKRRDEDPQQYDERKKRQSAQIISNTEDNVFARGEADYEALKEETGISVVKSDGFSTEYRFPDGSILAGLDSVGSRRLASVTQDNASVRDVLQQYAAGALTMEDVNTRLAFLENLPVNPRAGLNQSHGYLTPQRRAELEAVRVAAKALQAREAGASPEEIGNIFIAGFAPDPMEDYKVAKELVLDFLPLIGEYRSAQEVAVNYAALTAALEAGDWEAAAEAGLFGLLNAVGVVPGIGKAAKPISTLLTRALNVSKSGKKLLAQHKLYIYNDQYENIERVPKIKHSEVFQDIVEESNQKSIGMVVNQALGDAGELTVAEELHHAGALISTNWADKSLPKKLGGAARKRAYDIASPNGLRKAFGFLLKPTNAEKVTMSEVKFGHGKLDLSQKVTDEAVLATLEEVPVGSKTPIGAIMYFRVRLDQIPEKILRDELGKRLHGAVTRKENPISQEAADKIIERVVEIRANSSAKTPYLLRTIVDRLRHLLTQ